MQPNEFNGGELAYLGDAVLEVMMRRYALSLGIGNLGELNKFVISRIRATAQSEAIERLLPSLTEDEEAIYRRGRNANGISVPKSASAAEYRRATGLEALFGALYIQGRTDRLEELFAVAYTEEHEHEGNNNNEEA